MTNKSSKVPVKTGEADPAAIEQAVRPLTSLGKELTIYLMNFRTGGRLEKCNIVRPIR